MTNLHSPRKVHFLGIGGSGMSGVACLAKYQGYEVSGCDAQAHTAYSDKLEKFQIPTTSGHDVSHTEAIDYLVVTPAALFKNPLDSEVEVAKTKNILMTWQEFLGKFLQKDKEVICISGTHGKSTTTALTSLVFEAAQLDPNVMIGATIKEWGANFRVGKGNVFITESDEFYDNFLNYDPNVIVLNNIEFDHPDFFTSEEQLFTSFRKHLLKLTGKKTLIVNQGSEGVKKLLASFSEGDLANIQLIGYSLQTKLFDTPISLQGELVEKSATATKFKVSSSDLGIHQDFEMKLSGDYNVENVLGVIALAKTYSIDLSHVQNVLATFEGIGRRLEVVGEVNSVKVYDDYAHHPTAIKKTLEGLKQRHPDKKILAIIEPHSFSRTKALLNQYKDSFFSADKVVVGPIFKARDSEDFGVSNQSIVDVSGHSDILALNDLNEILSFVAKNITSDYVVVVMGAGESYKWTKEVLESLYK